MATRLELQTVLAGLQDGLNVYFQPPSTIQMAYPAIVYNRDFAQVEFGDNVPYVYTRRYQVMVIDRDPDSLVPDKVAVLPMTKYVRHFTTEGLNHDIFYLFF